MAVGAGVVLGLASVFCPLRLKPVFVAAIYVTSRIGFVVSHLILMIIYFVVITPIGLIMRLVGHDPLRLKFEPPAKIYWIDRKGRRSAASYFRQHRSRLEGCIAEASE